MQDIEIIKKEIIKQIEGIDNKKLLVYLFAFIHEIIVPED